MRNILLLFCLGLAGCATKINWETHPSQYKTDGLGNIRWGQQELERARREDPELMKRLENTTTKQRLTIKNAQGAIVGTIEEE